MSLPTFCAAGFRGHKLFIHFISSSSSFYPQKDPRRGRVRQNDHPPDDSNEVSKGKNNRGMDPFIKSTAKKRVEGTLTVAVPSLFYVRELNYL